MVRVMSDVWERLGDERVQGEALRARRATPDSCDDLIAALDAEGRRHFLIRMRPSDPQIRDVQSRGIEVQTRELAVAGQELGTYVDICCKDASGHDAFDLIGGELAARLATGIERPFEVVPRVLAKWRRFWGQGPGELLSKEQQVGLFAELWFLYAWLFPLVSPTEALRRWRGPTGSRHDFEWTGTSVEVKATTSPRGPVHRIHGLDQLALPESGKLLFFSQVLREEGGATNSLASVVVLCRGVLEVDASLLDQFEAMLTSAGYSQLFEEDYSALKLRVVSEGLYEVKGDFPRITTVELVNGRPTAVEEIEYAISLVGFTHLCVAQEPAAAAAYIGT